MRKTARKQQIFQLKNTAEYYEAVEVTGYDEYLHDVTLCHDKKNDETDTETYKLSKDLIKVSLNPERTSLNISFQNAEPISLDLLRVIDPLIKTLSPTIQNFPMEKMTFQVSNSQVDAQIRLRYIHLKKSALKSFVHMISVNILFRWF